MSCVLSPLDALFDLLMQMVTEPLSDDQLAKELSSVASACLFSLVISLGDTGKMLSSLAAMMTAAPALSEMMVQVGRGTAREYSVRPPVQSSLFVDY